MFKRIVLVEGSSISSEIVQSVKGIAGGKKNILLILDSNHTRQHVLSELRLYSPFVRKRNYIVVYDTSIEYLSGTGYPDRPWGKGNNPLTAVNEFLKSNDRFVIGEAIAHKLIITSAPGGFLKCIRD